MIKHYNHHKLSNSSPIHDHIEHFLYTTAANVYWKDKKGIYLGVNEIFLNTSAMQSEQEIIGTSDFEQIWSEQASLMQKHDQEIIATEKTKIIMESAKSPSGNIQYYLSHKMPLRSRKGKVIGIIGLSFPIDHKNPITFELDEALPLVSDFYPNDKASEHKKISNSVKLSLQQKKCLYHLVRGKTMRQIAEILQLSPKTVEHYLEAVKQKLNCSTRAELIEKALKLSFIKKNL